VPEDPSVNANRRKAYYVSFLINFMDAGRNKIYHYIWEACSGLWEILGFPNSYDFFA